ncbi:DNA-binding response regulator [Flavobacteriaceae bacterium PRS1]|jgi:DNA-binding response OmpR family regulator|nr:DNA-binding response regulator [Flavobacteriaceae bacterium PRS1]
MEKRKHILLVEDDESILFGLQDILEDNGYQISTASNGTEGLKLATDKEIDLLVLDIMLPGMSGIDICKKIKKIKFKLPIIMLTAKNSELDKVSGLDYGADDYITKPFSL